MIKKLSKFVRAFGRGLLFLVRAPFAVVSLATELLFSNRALAVGSLAIAALFAVGPWVRPPLSRDLRGVQIPLGLWDGSEISHQQIVLSKRTWRLDSVATPLLAVIGVGALVVLFRPRWLPAFSGPLVTLGMAACAITMLNHPVLIDALDGEWQQRGQIRKILGQNHDELLTVNSRPRVEDAEDEDPVAAILRSTGEEPASAWTLLVFGPWPVGFCLLVTLCSISGNWARCLGYAAVFVFVGVLLSGAVTARRLVAEYHWNNAVDLEEANRFSEARLAINQLLVVYPEYGERAQCWRLRGQIDVRDGRDTIFAEYFRLRQLFSAGDLDRSRSRAQDLLGRFPQSVALADLAADIDIQTALHRLVQSSSAGSEMYWQDACYAAPWRLDSRVGLAVALAKGTDKRPELVELQLVPFLDHLGDRVLRSDLAAVVGDAYFEAGDYLAARGYYNVALDAFSLPKYVNVHVQERLLGM